MSLNKYEMKTLTKFIKWVKQQQNKSSSTGLFLVIEPSVFAILNKQNDR